ncbi:hypothetical protein V3N99_07055 [Dermatophilaceae bacterium Soc4.6]
MSAQPLRVVDGSRLRTDPAVTLAYASRLLAPSTSYRQLEQVRRAGFARRVFSRSTLSTTTRYLRVATPVEPTWREPGAPVVPGVLYLPLAAQAAAQRASGIRPLAAVAGDDFSAA